MPRKTQVRAPQAQYFGRAAAWMFAVAGLCLAGADTPAASPTYDFRNPPQGVFDNQWMEIFIGGEKVGYAHQSYERKGDHVISQSHEEFRVRRLNFELTSTEDSTSEETLNGVPLSFHSVETMSGQPTVVDGRGDGKVFSITKTVGAFRDAQQVTFPEGTLMAWGQERLGRIKGLEQGTTYEFPNYDPSDNAFGPMPVRVAVGGREKIQVQGKEIEATRVTLHILSASGEDMSQMVSWVDANYRSPKMSMDMGGLSMEMMACSEEQAKGDYVSKDIFSASLITISQPVPAGASSVTFLLHRADGQPLPAPPESATEHGEKLADGVVAITLKRAPKIAKNNTPLGAGLPDTAPYLARNSFLDTSDPLVRKLATEAGGPEGTEPVSVAWQLRDFVADYINKKDLSVGFATASETAKSREGDCTEHAVLLAALGRVRGLPARTVSGLVYMPVYEGQKNVLGFHMWTQFFFNGQWMDFDSALTDGAEPYWRLGLVASDLNEVSLSDFTLELMRWMAKLKITVANVGMQPKS